MFAASRYTEKKLSLKFLTSNTSVDAYAETTDSWIGTLWAIDVLLHMFHLNAIQPQMYIHANVSSSATDIDLNAT